MAAYWQPWPEGNFYGLYALVKALRLAQPDPVEILGGTSTLATLSFAVQAASLRDAAFVTLRVPAHAGLEAVVEFSAEDLVVVGS